MNRIVGLFLWGIAAMQAALFGRFLFRVASTYGGKRIPKSVRTSPETRISVIVPVLNEVDRLGPCLDALSTQDASVREILVVDGGSTDGTQELVSHFAQEDPRVRLIDASPVPEDWNGKAWGLETGLRSSSSDSDWLVTVDADVRCEASAIDRSVAFATEEDVPFLSIACQQVANNPSLSIVHPSMLSTLVYRFGIPGSVARSIGMVQSNGQFAVFNRSTLLAAGGFTVAKDSICEDFTIARHLHLCGFDVGFYEGEHLARTEMHADGWECLRNWPRSLGLRDRFRPNAGIEGVINVGMLQVLPLLFLAWRPSTLKKHPILWPLNRALLGARIGVMLGTKRAYADSRWTYWLSPLADPITWGFSVAALVRSRHSWRGRTLILRNGETG